jgi:NAD-dependent dihydropyrimidine dehydrogenase PreA subunit
MSLEGIAPFDEDEAKRFADDAYRRGVISVAEGGGRYRIADFYGRLDIFAIMEQDAYRALPGDVQAALDAWYFDAYYAGLDWDLNGGKPTDENIFTLDETLSYIDENYEKGRQIYLTDCDCRSLRGGCNSPTLVCLSYRDGPNSYPDRGISKPITHREARAVVVAADRAALVHTVNPGGICLGRCGFGVFDGSDFSGARRASADYARCVGCGVCVGTCPTDALTIGLRNAV